ncbi:peptidylprolyl isomerase [Patescibacteria group bacterium]
MGRQQKIKQQRKIDRALQEKEITRKTKIFTRNALTITIILVVTISALLLVKMIKTEPVPQQAILKTERGDITIELYSKAAPKTVDNFVKLAGEDFYDGLKFHRVVEDFMIQGGDPKGDGTGGPGYIFDDEINPRSLDLTDLDIAALESEGYVYDYSLKSKPVAVGAVAMANSGPNTNGSQFFIVTTRDQPHLNGKHTVFAGVIAGLDIAKSITQGDTIEDIVLVW